METTFILVCACELACECYTPLPQAPLKKKKKGMMTFSGLGSQLRGLWVFEVRGEAGTSRANWARPGALL